MEIEDLRVFTVVYRSGSFAAAARKLALDPSRVSRLIKALEEEIGSPLFERTTRRLTATESGDTFFHDSRSIVEAFDAARDRVRDLQQAPKGTVRVSAPVSFSLLNVVPLLPEFLDRYRGISVDLDLHDGSPNVGHGGVDVAIALGPLVDSDAVAVPLARMRTRVCASPHYLSVNGRPKSPEELESHDALLLDMPGFDGLWRFRRCEEDGWLEVPMAKSRFRTSNAIALKDACLAGAGLVLQADWIVGRELADGRLVDLFPAWEVRSAAFNNPAMWLLHPRQPYVPERVRVFIEFLKERIGEGCLWAGRVEAS